MSYINIGTYGNISEKVNLRLCIKCHTNKRAVTKTGLIKSLCAKCANEDSKRRYAEKKLLNELE